MGAAKNQTFGKRIWDNSATYEILALVLQQISNASKLSSRYGIFRWIPFLESLLSLLIAFMPVLQSWDLIIPLMVLLCFCRHRPVCPVAKELFVFWLMIIISAVFSGGFWTGLSNLMTFSLWLGIVYLGGYVFSPEFTKRFLGILCFSSLFWMIIGFWQQISGVPTPTGWLGSEVINWIKVRSYSVFGNPNLFALYLLIILVISSDSIIFLAGRLRSDTCFYKSQGSSWGLISACTDSKRRRTFLWVNLLLSILILSTTLVALYYTYSRFAWFLGTVFLGLRFWPRLGNKRWLIAVMAFIFLCTVQGIKIRINPLLSLTDSSMWYRIHIWQGVLSAITDHWLWGFGPGSFRTVYPWYQISNTTSVHAHQLYLQIWFENGILSLMAFLWLVWKMAVNYWKTFNQTTGRLLKYFSFNPTSPVVGTTAMIVIVFLCYGLAESWTQNQLISGYFWLFCGLGISSVMSYK
jgi:O-antigen ligase